MSACWNWSVPECLLELEREQDALQLDPLTRGAFFVIDSGTGATATIKMRVPEASIQIGFNQCAEQVSQDHELLLWKATSQRQETQVNTQSIVDWVMLCRSTHV